MKKGKAILTSLINGNSDTGRWKKNWVPLVECWNRVNWSAKWPGPPGSGFPDDGYICLLFSRKFFFTTHCFSFMTLPTINLWRKCIDLTIVSKCLVILFLRSLRLNDYRSKCKMQPWTSLNLKELKNASTKHFENNLKTMHIFQRLMGSMNCTKTKCPQQWGFEIVFHDLWKVHNSYHAHLWNYTIWIW